MGARTRRLFGPARLATDAPTLVYTVPLGRVAIVKVVRVLNVTATAETLDYAVGVLDEGHALLWGAPVPGADLIIDRAEWTAHGGEELWMRASTGDALTVVGSGSLLVSDEPAP